MVIEIEKGILTLAFKDFFDKSFIDGTTDKESYQPLNNATEIPPIDPNLIGKEGENMDDDDVPPPEPIYVPRKVIPLSPVMVRIVWEHRGQNFSGIINSIREHAWYKMKAFKNVESRKNYLYLISRTIQAFWGPWTTRNQRKFSYGQIHPMRPQKSGENYYVQVGHRQNNFDNGSAHPTSRRISSQRFRRTFPSR
jgi:hypothetical protein